MIPIKSIFMRLLTIILCAGGLSLHAAAANKPSIKKTGGPGSIRKIKKIQPAALQKQSAAGKKGGKQAEKAKAGANKTKAQPKKQAGQAKQAAQKAQAVFKKAQKSSGTATRAQTFKKGSQSRSFGRNASKKAIKNKAQAKGTEFKLVAGRAKSTAEKVKSKKK
jgi:hypothetical protein